MLAKLLKQELKVHSGVLGMLCAASLGVGLLGGLTLRYLLNVETSGQQGALYTLSILLLIFSWLALVVFSVGSGLYLLYQFYKRKFTDEGYLTFTLPVASWQIFLSSLLNIMIWSFICGVVTLMAILMIVFIGLVNSEFLRELGMAFSEMQKIFGSDFKTLMPEINVPLEIAAILVQMIGHNVIVMTCITVGSILAKRRKLLGAIGTYWVYSMISSAVSSQMLSSFILEGSTSLNAYYLFMLIYALVLSAAGFILSCWLMNKKLNLP